jgi:type IV pilus assembly protein PilV
MNRQRGLTLIEVLIAVVVLAIGLLGIAGLQSAALANNLISYQYTQASTIAQAMLERMRANRDGVLAGGYALEPGAAVPSATANCATTTCSPAEQAQWDIAAIVAQLSSTADDANLSSGPRGVLPGSHLSITCDDAPCTADSLRIVTVYWDAGRREPDTVDCDALRCIALGYVP